MFRARFTSLNLAQLTNWVTRFPILMVLINTVFRSSIYAFQECTYDMAVQIAKSLGWGTPGEPCWRTDENRNTVMWDPKKYRDLDTRQISLTAKAHDLGDEHFRSVCWVLLEHEETKVQLWVGSSHLSNGADAGAERTSQARVLASTAPVGHCVLGIDRNSLALSSPAQELVVSGLIDLTVGKSKLRTYPAGDNRTDEVQIDAIHGRGIRLSNVLLSDPGKATDHRAWVATIEISTT